MWPVLATERLQTLSDDSDALLEKADRLQHVVALSRKEITKWNVLCFIADSVLCQGNKGQTHPMQKPADTQNLHNF